MQLNLLLCLLVEAVATQGTLVPYWNVPLETCSRQGVFFDLDQFDIVHNPDNAFTGDKVNILYSPGRFPHYTATGDLVNGGIPQRGNLSLHLTTFRHQLQLLPSNYTGLLVLDFELYLPSFSVSLPSVYRDESVQWVQQRHPNWTHAAVLREAQRTFNVSAKPYFEALLQEAIRQHPATLIGYYHYPYCEDYDPPFLHCAPQLQELNDGLRTWLLNNSQALYPSLYLQQRYSAARQWRVVRAKLAETQRIKEKNVPVLPYLRYRYGGSEELVERAALLRLLWLIRTSGSEGLVVWGALDNLATRKSCLEFKDYLYNTLGPALKCFHNMTDQDLQEIQSRFSALSHRWTSIDENGSQYYHYRTGSRGRSVEMFQNFLNYNQYINLKSYHENFHNDHTLLSQLNDQNFNFGSETLRGSHASNIIALGEETKRFATTKISSYPDSSALFALSTLIQHHCAL